MKGISVTLFPYPRLAHLFEVIHTERLPQAELAKRFGVSSRTIRTDITELNNALRHYGAQILYKRGSGYSLRIEDHTLFASLPKQKQMIQTIPRTASDRVDALLLKLLLATQPVKLDDIAEAWCISRGTLQHDMGVVREIVSKYPLQLTSIPRLGTRLTGNERIIRSCLTDTLLRRFSLEVEPSLSQFRTDILADIDLTYIETILQNSLTRFGIRLNNEGRQYLIFNCAVSILRITRRHELTQGVVHEWDNAIQNVAYEISQGLICVLGSELSDSEAGYLAGQIAAQRIPQHDNPTPHTPNSHQWVDEILNDINASYNYDLRHDSKLRSDLATHLTVLISRLQQQISTKNPLLTDIKQHYPFAYEVTVSALTRIEDQLPFAIGEDELGYLAVHIGVGLERHYGGSTHVLVVTDSGNATRRMIEAKIAREFPQLKIQRVLPLHEYNALDYVEENFVITTLRLPEKNKPIVKIAPFPTAYQLEQIGRLAMMEQTRPYILERFFDERYFMVIKEDITQEILFKTLCRKLRTGGYVREDFCPSLIEREAIVSTLLGENIALPHSLGLLALKTVVVTVLAPKGIEWSKETKARANVIFLLAISKQDYEEAMAIYDLFITFVREKATKRLLRSRNFHDFQIIAKDSLGRSI
ncbi:BglG family transcription antiterminator [Xenorhabdus bovienii]|uniref:BglG family transcription antiterminator n=1 Tax=Xenorhabdus bovienii TaxID=40576 RepID=UPI0023B30B08|nr:PRD domain-containing protein [Xenorhabdus bovienii]MDE9495640.1 BglG family transcription antiterminator [Xenorhabdus bovienii]MDE9503845.1 BglG family transcription antiterminator [Xenorhabdus bovienii]MDE9519063.1 BglG family transcription antiterminator [Xenorhabdus bovienii]MDE9527613.1 BglG family transcription antiterminator [Xenorhabdus bovienii]MDE9570834.1 BglG family transcription antiterminator [Xenorhabdus bovienii]